MSVAAAATATATAAAEPARQAAAAAAGCHNQQAGSRSADDGAAGPALQEQHIAIDRSGLAQAEEHSHGPPRAHKLPETDMTRHLKALIRVGVRREQMI